ncbi:Histone transcription regulator 3 [Coemansia sp. RSA 552]|nr:Histone transcription regulator 3 [Coemansia sp. RSA 552]
MTWQWLDSAKIARREDVSKALGNYTTLAELFAKQFRGSRKHSGRRRLQTDSGDGHSDWSFAAQSGNLPDAARAVDDISDKYSSSLAALTADAGGSDLQADSDASDPGLSWLLSIPSCQKLFDGNCGIFGVLQSFADTVMLAIYSSPEVFFKSPRLKNISFRVLNTIHEVLLDRADAGLTAECSPDECRQIVRWGTFAILVLASAATSMNSCQDLCNHMRHEWIAISNRAISRLQAPDSDLCIAQYRIAEAWTDYELGVIANDIGRAAASVSKCQDLLLHTPEASSVALVAHCSITGAPVNLELIEQRQSHLLRFVQLRDAARMVRVDKEQAIGLLGAFAEPFAEVPDCGLAFSQRIAAVRLLTALYHDLAMDTDEIRSIMYELYLILSQLAANSSDTTIPMRLVIDRCVTCLQRIHSMAATSQAVDQYIESLHAEANVTSRLPQCLLLMSLALTQHFYIGPLPDSPLSSPEAAFVGLALWLAAKLTCGIALPLPMSPTDPQPKEARAGTGNVSPISNCSSQTTQSDESDSTKELDSYTRAFGSIHDVLGERGLCTAANGALLRHLLRVCREHLGECPERSAYWDVSGACLRCLFDIKLHNTSPDRHPCVHLDMNHESANAVYLLVESELLDTLRSRKGAGLRGDLKAIVEKTSAALSDVDISLLPRIGMNMDIIDDYLDGATMPVFSQLERALRSNFDVLHVACLPPKDSYADDGVPTACLSLPFVRATMQHDILRARMRSGVPRAVEDYDEVLEDYKLNVSLNPASAEAWHQLGQAHSDLADELLLGTASEIMKNKYDIAILLRSALSCTVQAKQLLAPLPATARAAQDGLACEDSSPSGDMPGQLHTRVYSLAGRLLYRIAARPLPLLALKVLPSNILVSDDSNGGDESRQEWDVGRWAGSRSTVSMYQALTRRYTTVPSKVHIYRLARAMLLHASRLDPANWKWCYMLGKATAKLQDPLTSCAYYLKAYHLAAADTMDTSLPAAAAPSQPLTSFSVPEPAMDAIYKLLATLTKLVWQQRLDVPIAQRFLDALPCSVTGECADLATRSAPGGEDAVPVHSTEANRVLYAIRGILDRMNASDKRRWYHRSVFLLAWLDHHVFGDSERAKQDLLTLLQMRNTNKQLASFYKTDFEMPGKHYLYLEKYLLLYIDTLAATQDVDGLHLLIRKLKRSSESLYRPATILARTTSK